MMLRLVYLLLGLILFAPKSIACDCNYGGSFMKMAKKAEVVVLVRVIKYKSIKNQPDAAMSADVIKTYKGKDIKSTITIWGDSGMECRPYVSAFALGKEYIIALNRTDEGSEKLANYSVSVCGAYWLTINEKHQLVYGDIDSLIGLPSFTTSQKFELALKKVI
jgi:hypothetical protein